MSLPRAAQATTMPQLGRYEILAELGRGAMGAVFRARDPRIDRIVAVKTIAVPAGDANSAGEYRQRFFREAQAAGRLSHPGIVTIYDVGEEEGSQSPFIVMEFIDGRALSDVVAAAEGGPLPLDTALDLIRQIAVALDYAHGQGIVHRDIKPSNILVTRDGQAKIADFGIAKLSLAEVTLSGNLLGTPAYMSPEQISGKPIDGRSDLFSLGVIAYWLVTGEKPFPGESLTELSLQIATQNPKPASTVIPALGQDVDHVLERALAKDPDRRYQRGGELAADVADLRGKQRPRSLVSQEPTVLLQDPVVATKGSSAAAPAVSTKAAPLATAKRGDGSPRRRSRAWLYLVLAAAVAVAVAAFFFTNFHTALPADLQIVGQYPFSSGEVYIWIDGDLRYHDQVHSAVRIHKKAQHTGPAGEAIALTLPLRAGEHTVRVRIDASDEGYDGDTAIPGEFRAWSLKTLHLDFKGKDLNLSWE
jgi:serine/threonine-protein kinase